MTPEFSSLLHPPTSPISLVKNTRRTTPTIPSSPLLLSPSSHGWQGKFHFPRVEQTKKKSRSTELRQKNEGPDKTVIPCRSIFQGCNCVSTTTVKLCKVISRLLQRNKTVEGGDGNKVTRLTEKKRKKIYFFFFISNYDYHHNLHLWLG